MHLSGTGNIGTFDPTHVYDNTTKVQAAKKSEIALEPIKSDRLPSLGDLKDYSIKAFDCFKDNWVFSKFWIRANTCDACVCFVESFIKHFPKHPESDQMRSFIQDMLKQNLDFYKSTAIDTMWNDDFGWWGSMALNAHSLLKTIGNDELAKKYLDLARDCWSYMKKTSYDESDSSQPVPHGFRNNTADAPGVGVKNTVVNSLPLLLSARLYSITGENLYLDMAKSQWLWFSKWFEIKDNGYLNTFGNNAALVGERPLADGSDYKDRSHPDYTDGWIWTGDQGVLIGGLSELHALKEILTPSLSPQFAIEVGEIIYKLGRGVKEALIGNGDGVFHEPPCNSSYNSYGNDYLGGRGILVRYMRSKESKNLLGVDFTENILKTVQALWSTKDETTNQFKPEYATDDQNKEYFNQYKGLLGYADNVNWTFDLSDPNLINAVSQAVGLDFLSAALSTFED